MQLAPKLPPEYGNQLFDEGVERGISWHRTGTPEYRQATAHHIVNFVRDNILEPDPEVMPLDEERFYSHMGFLTGWIISQFL